VQIIEVKVKVTNLKQLVFIISVFGLNNTVYAGYGSGSLTNSNLEISDEKLVSTLKGLIADGKILYDADSGTVQLNNQLFKLMSDKNLLKDGNTQLSGDCGIGGGSPN
jgi:hypothetical protein